MVPHNDQWWRIRGTLIGCGEWSCQCNTCHTVLCCRKCQVAHTCTWHSSCRTPGGIDLASNASCTSLCTAFHNLIIYNKLYTTQKQIYTNLIIIKTLNFSRCYSQLHIYLFHDLLVSFRSAILQGHNLIPNFISTVESDFC